MRILLTGGGTGGHIIPLIAVVEELVVANKDIIFFYLGPMDTATHDIFKQYGIQAKHVISSKWRRYFSIFNIIDLIKLPFGFIDVLLKIYKIKPNIVFSKGGYGSFWPVIVSFILRIPVLLHESDSAPGLTNRILSYFSDKIAISFKESAIYFSVKKCVLTGNPIRKELCDLSVLSRANNQDVKQIFIIGGSQGSVKINMLILQNINCLLDKYFVVHQCGIKNYAEMRALSDQIISVKNKNRYALYGFLNLDQLKEIYLTSQLIVARSGAGAIFEIAAAAKPSILIPLLSAAQNHQLLNANIYSKYKACLVLLEDSLDGVKLLEKIDSIFDNDKLREEMIQSSKLFFREYKHAAKKIAEEVLSLAVKI